MSRTFKIVWGVVLMLAALIWFTDGVRLIFDPNYKLERLGMILASFITAWWLFEGVLKITKDE